MRKGKIIMLSAILIAGLCQHAKAQDPDLSGKYSTITTAVPFMRISPDARSGSMGEVGLAISPDANSHFWNVAKVVMNENEAGLSISYTPWLRDIVGDISLSYLSGYYKFGPEDNKNQAISASLRYFNLGQIQFTNLNAEPAGQGNPNEYAFDIGYSRKLSESFSIGLTGKFIHSDVMNGVTNSSGTQVKAGNSFGVDFGAFYTKLLPENEQGFASKLNFGAAITNLGSKISYTGDRKDFIPTNLGLGAAYEYNLDEFNQITFALDMNKLLVPSPTYLQDSAGNLIQTYPHEKSLMSGVFGSFGDAYEGGSEEFKEIMWSVGAEYAYQKQFFARAGYFYETQLKGDRKYLTLGLGVKYNIFGLNFAYLVPSGSGINRNPLANTLRFSLMFDFADFSKIAKGKPKEKKEDSRTEQKSKTEEETE